MAEIGVHELHDEVGLVGAVDDAVQLGEEGCDQFVYQVILFCFFLFSSLVHSTQALYYDNDTCLDIKQHFNNLCVLGIAPSHKCNGEIGYI